MASMYGRAVGGDLDAVAKPIGEVGDDQLSVGAVALAHEPSAHELGIRVECHPGIPMPGVLATFRPQ